MGSKRSSFTLLGLAWLALGGCDAQGCSNLTPLPAGFPAAARIPNATQLRVSDTGVAAFEAQPSLVVAQLLGGSLVFDMPPSCGGSSPTCCTGGTPVTPCGPLSFDVELQDGDAPRLELSPVQGSSRVDVTFRARLATQADVPVNVMLVGDCGMKIDTAPGATEDVAISMPINFVQDATAGTTRLVVGDLVLTGLTTDDVALTGNVACQLANLGLDVFTGTLVSMLTDRIKASLDGSLCRACPSGDVAECGAFADACTDQVCMSGFNCLQELGALGRLSAGALFGGAPPGSAGALDVHELAGGYATTNSDGLALGVLAGMLPSGAARDRCGPSATAPVPASVPQSAFFQGNVRPDDAAPFDVALGFHATELEQLAYAAYEGGVLCPTVDTSALPALTSDALDADLPTLADLTGGEVPLAVGLRPQAPPTFVLGTNTFDLNDAVVDPLIDLSFEDMELDLFAYVEQQPIRVLTLVADVSVPLGVQIDGNGALVAVLGGAAGADAVSVKSSQGLDESDAELEAVAPRLLEPVLPELVRRLDLSTLPSLLGMRLSFTSVTTVDSLSFVALFADLVAPAATLRAAADQRSDGTALASVDADADADTGRSELARPAWDGVLRFSLVALIGLAVAFASRRRSTRWAVGATLGAIVVALPIACGDDDGGGGGTKDAGPDAAVDGGIRGEGGRGGSGAGRDDGGQPDDGGTAGSGDTDSGQGGDGTGGTGGAGGTGDDHPCGSHDCESGDVDHGDLGQWSSVDTGSNRTVIASYDAELGDLVLVELDDGDQTWRVIDGVPDETPTHEPDSYRGGIEQAGPDVGAWSSVRLDGSRVALAYQDRDRGALRAAFEDTDGDFHPHEVDDSNTAGVELGTYASLALGDTPSIAYLATGVPGSGGDHLTELRLATATKRTPTSEDDWTTTVVASAVVDEAAAGDLPNGPGLFVNLLVLDDGRRVLVHYDHAQRALVAHVETDAGSEDFDETVLDGGGALDRGRWVSAVLDDDGLVHVAYEDSIGHQVFYLTFMPGDDASTPELVDDGTRASDRPHWVGASLALWLDDGDPRVAYQDAVSADVVLATWDGSWSHDDVSSGSGALLDGFHLAAPAQGAGPLVWDRVTPASTPSHELVVLEAP